MIPVYAYSLSCSVIGKQSLRRRRDASPAHVCAIGRPGGDGGSIGLPRRRQLQRLGRHVSFVRCLLHTYVLYLFALINNQPSSSGTLNLEIVEIGAARETTIEFFSVAAPQIRKLTQTRALHQSRHYSSHTTQLDPPQSRTILSLSQVPTYFISYSHAADTPAQLQWLVAATAAYLGGMRRSSSTNMSVQ